MASKVLTAKPEGRVLAMKLLDRYFQLGGNETAGYDIACPVV